MVDTAAILAGGLATRLRPITERVPKSLISIAGRPFIHRQLALLRRRSIRRVVLCLGHLGEQVAAAVGNGERWGLEIQCSYDGPTALGTAGALRRARHLLGDRFWVLYGDSYLDFSYVAACDYFEREGKDHLGLMTVFANQNRWDKSNIVFREGALLVYDKARQTPEMEYIDYGATLLCAAALDLIPHESYDLADLYSHMVESRLMLGFEVCERFYEIGSYPGIEDISRYFTLKEAEIETTRPDKE